MTTPPPVTRYTWTTNGLTPNFGGHGAMRYVRETDYEQLERDLAAREGELAAMKQRAEAAELSAINYRAAAKTALTQQEAAERKAEEAARDAGRWRHWRKKWATNFIIDVFGGGCINKTLEMAEAKIDAEIAAIAAKGEA